MYGFEGETEFFQDDLGTVSPRAEIRCIEGDFGGFGLSHNCLFCFRCLNQKFEKEDWNNREVNDEELK